MGAFQFGGSVLYMSVCGECIMCGIKGTGTMIRLRITAQMMVSVTIGEIMENFAAGKFLA